MRRIKIYGADNTVVENYLQPVQATPEEQARYKHFKILTITAFVLLVILFLQSMVLVAVRLLFVDELITRVIGLGIEIVTLAMCVGLLFGYKYLYHTLSYTDMGVIIFEELLLVVCQQIVYSYSVPILFYSLIFLSSLFVLYTMIFLDCGVKYRLIISVIPAFILFITSFIYVDVFEFTPRYIYVSNIGYTENANDESNFYYSNAVNAPVEGYEAIDEVLELTNTMSNTLSGAHSVDDLEYMNRIFARTFPAGDTINFNNTYDEEFFEENCLYFSIMELDDKDDTIECKEIQHSFMYARPVIEYTRNSLYSEDTDERAVCLMVFEVSLDVYEKEFDNIAGFTTDKAKIYYK